MACKKVVHFALRSAFVWSKMLLGVLHFADLTLKGRIFNNVEGTSSSTSVYGCFSTKPLKRTREYDKYTLDSWR